MPPSWVNIDVQGQNMEGYLTQPAEDGKYPAVVVIQEIWGVNSHIQYLTDRFPAQGYVGLAPAMFHREGPMTIGLHDEMPPALERMGHCTDDGILADVRAAVDYLKAQPFVDPNRIGIVGFCFGGPYALLGASRLGCDGLPPALRPKTSSSVGVVRVWPFAPMRIASKGEISRLIS